MTRPGSGLVLARVRLKWQLMLPFGLLAVLWAATGSYLLTRTATSRAESRIDAELYERVVTSGNRFTDLVAGEIELERLAAYTAGVPEAVEARRPQPLAEALTPLLVNSRADVVAVYAADGTELVALWRNGSAVEQAPADLPLDVRMTMWAETEEAMNKSVRVSGSSRGNLLVSAGAVPAAGPRGRVIVGLRAENLATKLATVGGVSLYDARGNLVGSTGAVPAVPSDATMQDGLVRTNIGSDQVLVGSLKGRGQTILRLAVFSQAGSIVDEVRATALALALLGLVATFGVLLLGWWLARTITRRLERVAAAARRITSGDLSPRAEVVGSDEIGLLAATFNTMTSELAIRSHKLEERERHFRSIVQNSSDVVMIVDRFGKFVYQSPSLTTIFGHDPDEQVGAHLSTIVHADDLGRLSSTIGAISAEPGSHRSVSARLRHADGRWRRTEIVLTNLLEEPAVAGIVLNTRDVTERTQLEDQLRHQAYHDALTGLANRVLFNSRVREVLNSTDDRDIAVLFVDLDDFKTVNDSLGHAAGDLLLQAVARRLESCLRPQDIVARLGGDEFALLLQAGDGPLDAYGVSQRILDALQAPVSIDGREIVVCASIGVADDASTASTVDELLQHADLALAEAKRKGRNRFEPYQQVMANQVHERLELGVQLRRGLERDELSVHYQPIFDLGSGRLAGFEALSRWTTVNGVVSPDLFIPLAEETGLIHAIGRRALDESCRQLRRWQLATGDEGLSVSVNLSVRQLQEPDLVEHVQSALEASQLDPSCLTLELTESVLMHDADVAADQLALLRAVGVKLAIDDFGTGYSSLSYIEQFPVDVLKVDKSFIDGVVDGTRRAALLRTIASLGSALGLTTVAEGVETDEQLAMLASLGYDRAQGYFLGRPMPTEEVDVLLAIDHVVAEPAAADGQVRIAARRY